MVRAAVYLRVSLDSTGEMLGVDRHRAECERIAGERHWDIVAEYVDNSISASDRRKDRPGYDALVRAYQAGTFEALLCWDLDRLTRQPRQLEDWIEAAEEHGLMLVTANGEADLTTDSGRTYARIRMAIARGEVERMGARRRLANRQRAELGKPPLGVRLTGYTSQGDIVAAEAEVVRKIFDRFARGDSLDSLTRWLQESGASTRHGRPWNDSTVRGILTNPRYAGRAVYQGKVTGRPGGWTPLVDEAVFDVIQARLSDPRRRRQQGTDRQHLGSGLYLCGVCDQPVSSWSGHRYRCKRACVCRARSNIDEYVQTSVRQWLARPDLADLLPVDESPQVRRLTGELTRLRSRLLTVESDYDNGDIDGRRYAVATEKIHAELASTEAALATASRGRELAALRSNDPVGAYDAGSLMMRQAIIRAICEVRLYPAPRGRKTFDPATVKIEYRQ